MTEIVERNGEEFEEQRFQCWLVLRHKTGEVKVYKTRGGAKRNEGPFDKIVEVDLTTLKPVSEAAKIKGEVTFSRGEVSDAVLQEIVADDEESG